MILSTARHPVKVYVVTPWNSDSPIDPDEIRVFDCLSTAAAYSKHLVDEIGYDESYLLTKEVCMESALAA